MVFLPALFPLIAFVVSFGLCKLAQGRFLLNYPNERSSHITPTSRFGGVAIWLSLLLTFGVAYLLLDKHFMDQETVLLAAFFLTPTSILAMMGAVDDKFHVHPFVRLLGQILFCWVTLHFFKFTFDFTPFYILNQTILLFLMLAFVNAGNFSDSLNGLWSGTVLIWIGYFCLLQKPSLLLAIFAAAILGFFILNFPRGCIFLGDSGSTFLGGGVLLLGLYWSQSFTFQSQWHPLTALTIAFAPFIFVFADVVLTLILRVAKGHSPLQAHREHFNQRLVHKLGLSHTTVTLLYFFGSILSSFIVGFSAQQGFLSLGFVLYVPLQALFFAGVWRLLRLMGQ